MTDLTFNEYESLVRRAHAARTTWRLGQTYVNVLHTFAPAICLAAEAEHIDCFYRDDMIPGFLEFVKPRLAADDAACPAPPLLGHLSTTDQQEKT